MIYYANKVAIISHLNFYIIESKPLSFDKGFPLDFDKRFFPHTPLILTRACCAINKVDTKGVIVDTVV